MKKIIATLLLGLVTTSAFGFNLRECNEIDADLDSVADRMEYVDYSKEERDLVKQSLINSKKWVEIKYSAMTGMSIIAIPILTTIPGGINTLIQRASEGLPFERQTDLKFIDEEIQKLVELDKKINQGKIRKAREELLAEENELKNKKVWAYCD